MVHIARQMLPYGIGRGVHVERHDFIAGNLQVHAFAAAVAYRCILESALVRVEPIGLEDGVHFQYCLFNILDQHLENISFVFMEKWGRKIRTRPRNILSAKL